MGEIGVGRQVPYVKPGYVSTHIKYSTYKVGLGATVDVHNGDTRRCLVFAEQR